MNKREVIKVENLVRNYKMVHSDRQDEEEILKTYQTEDYDYLANSATGMDCTGLMHRTPSNENEMESYQEVYQYLPPNVRVDAMDGKDSHK